jgi:hypothetical protein
MTQIVKIKKMVQYALGFQAVNFWVSVTLKEKILFGKRGKAKKNVTIARFHLFFTWTFQKRGSVAPGHVSTLFFPANETVRGIEHAQLKKEA